MIDHLGSLGTRFLGAGQSPKAGLGWEHNWQADSKRAKLSESAAHDGMDSALAASWESGQEFTDPTDHLATVAVHPGNFVSTLYAD